MRNQRRAPREQGLLQARQSGIGRNELIGFRIQSCRRKTAAGVDRSEPRRCLVVIAARFHQLGVNLGDVTVVVLGSLRPDGRHAQLRVEFRLLGAIVGELFRDALLLFLEHGQAAGIAGLLLVGGVLDVARRDGVGQCRSRVRVHGMRRDGDLVAGSYARHFHSALQPVGRALVAFAALLPNARRQLSHRACKHVGAHHAQHLLLDVGVVRSWIVVIRPVHGRRFHHR